MIELDGDKVDPNNFGFFTKLPLQHYSHTSKTHKYCSQFPQLKPNFFFSNELWKLRIKTKPNKKT